MENEITAGQKELDKAIKNIAKSLETLRKKLEESVGDVFKKIGDPIEKAKGEVENKTKKVIEGLVKKVEGSIETLKGSIQKKINGVVKKITDPFEKVKNKIEEKVNGVVDKLTKPVDAFGKKIEELAVGLIGKLEGPLKKVGGGILDFLGLGDNNEEGLDEADPDSQEKVKGPLDILLETAEGFANGLLSTFSGLFDKLTEAGGGILDLIGLGDNDEEGLDEADPDSQEAVKGPLAILGEGVEGLADGLLSTFSGLFDGLKEGAGSLFDSLSSSLSGLFGGGEGGGGLFSGLLDGLTSTLSGLFSGGGSLLSGLFGGITSLFGFADGGRPPVGVPSLVGERGPELFVPNTAGQIVPNDQLGMGGAQVSLNVTTGVQATVQAEMIRLMPKIQESVKSAVADSRLRGGGFATAMGT